MVSQPWPIRPATEMYNVSVGKPRPGLHGEQGRLLLSKAHGQASNTITSHRQRRRLGRGWEHRARHTEDDSQAGTVRWQTHGLSGDRWQPDWLARPPAPLPFADHVHRR